MYEFWTAGTLSLEFSISIKLKLKRWLINQKTPNSVDNFKFKWFFQAKQTSKQEKAKHGDFERWKIYGGQQKSG